jgi:hypothetical protein
VTGNEVERGGLAGPIGADNTGHLAGFYGEVEILYSHEPVKRFGDFFNSE